MVMPRMATASIDVVVSDDRTASFAAAAAQEAGKTAALAEEWKRSDCEQPRYAGARGHPLRAVRGGVVVGRTCRVTLLKLLSDLAKSGLGRGRRRVGE